MIAYTRPEASLDVAAIEAQAHALRSAAVAQYGRNFGRAFAQAVRGLVSSIREARRMDAQFRELSALSDRELRDMGITRSDIPAIVAGVMTRESAAAPAAVATLAPKAAKQAEPANEDVRIAA